MVSYIFIIQNYDRNQKLETVSIFMIHQEQDTLIVRI